MKKLTTEEFIERAKAAHGNKYNYDLVEYLSINTAVKILCQKHGEFTQRPKHHLYGCGCPLCKVENTNELNTHSTDTFVSSAKRVHGSKYLYDLTIYKGSRRKVKITCPTHGVFEQTPSRHLEGHGCRKCHIIAAGKLRRSSTEDFIQKATALNGDRYSYHLVKYEGSTKKVSIICHRHGLFKQTPNSHLAGSGCPCCSALEAGDKLRKTTTQFVEEAKLIHANKEYNYSEVDYYSSEIPVKIFCKEHGLFLQRPRLHLSGMGCPSCATNGFNTSKEGFLYILESLDMIKVGITNGSVLNRTTRVNKRSPQKFTPVFYRKMQGNIANVVETLLLKWLSSCGLHQPKSKFDGYTECFYNNTVSVLDIVGKVFEFERKATYGTNH